LNNGTGGQSRFIFYNGTATTQEQELNEVTYTIC